MEYILQTNELTKTYFSLGMKQRLGIAVSILNQPKFLILDEPTNGLDPFGIEELRNLIQNFVKKGITILVSSHILSEIQQIADYIGILCDGELKYEGKISEGVQLFQMEDESRTGKNKHYGIVL